MHLRIEAACPVDGQDALMDLDSKGWWCACTHCQHRVSGHTYADTCLKAFMMTVHGSHRVARLPGHTTQKSVRSGT
jgi:hypothetical protein